MFDGAEYSSVQQVTIQVQDQAPVAAPSTFNVWTAQGVVGGTYNVLTLEAGADAKKARAAIEWRIAADNLIRAPGRTGTVIGALAAGVCLICLTAGIIRTQRDAIRE